LFADLSGFTALTEAHGDEEAADLAAEFCLATRRLLEDNDAEEIKTIGDAMMIRSDDARRAIHLGLSIVHEVGKQHGFPVVRVGMHTGPAVERTGDWFGSTVNVAARVSGAASGNQVLLSEVTRSEAGEVHGIELRERGRQTFKNVSQPLLLFEAVRQGQASTEGLPIDPVCRMAVDPSRRAGVLVHEGVEYSFCSLDCAGRFAAKPAAYTDA